MLHKHEVPVERLMVEHYLFDLGYSIEKVSEISGIDEESVREIYCDYKKYTLPTRSIK